MERPHGRRDELVSAEEADPLAAREKLQDEPGGLTNRLLERRERLLPLIAQPHHDDDLQRASQPRGVQRRGIPLDVAALLQRLDPPQAR